MKQTEPDCTHQLHIAQTHIVDFTALHEQLNTMMFIIVFVSLQYVSIPNIPKKKE